MKEEAQPSISELLANHALINEAINRADGERREMKVMVAEQPSAFGVVATAAP